MTLRTTGGLLALGLLLAVPKPAGAHYAFTTAWRRFLLGRGDGTSTGGEWPLVSRTRFT
jgi:hypothetical protein